MKIATKILQGDNSLIKMYKDPLTEDINPNFSRGSYTELFFFFIFLLITTGILQVVPPLSSLFCIGKIVISFAN